MTRQDKIANFLITMIAVVLFYFASSFLSSVLLFIPVFVVSLFVTIKLSGQNDFPSGKFLVFYLIALAVQMLHFAEEVVMDFHIRLPALLGQEPYSLNALIIFNMVAYFFFILGGIAIYLKKMQFMVIPVFYIMMGVVVNAGGHILLALYTGGYFPGLWTALILAFLAPFVIRQMFHTSEMHKA